MSINIDSIVRSVAIIAVGLPITLSITNLTNTATLLAESGLKRTPYAITIEELEEVLTRPCIDYFISKSDSKLERKAKNTIDDTLGDGAQYKALCDFIL
tara:strand:- start:1700 stop:1996 length:297 start_codon:yes stop_codon:yes gene_type:complete